MGWILDSWCNSVMFLVITSHFSGSCAGACTRRTNIFFFSFFRAFLIKSFHFKCLKVLDRITLRGTSLHVDATVTSAAAFSAVTQTIELVFACGFFSGTHNWHRQTIQRTVKMGNASPTLHSAGWQRLKAFGGQEVLTVGMSKALSLLSPIQREQSSSKIVQWC